jgi:hypothetical protein
MADSPEHVKTTGTRDVWRRAFIATGVALVVGGFLLSYLGVGADLGREQPVQVTVRAVDMPRESLGRVKVGDPVYTEPAGLYIGRVTKVVEGPMVEATPDASGALHAAPNPVKGQMDVTISATGRRSSTMTAVGSQVVSIGQRFAVYTPSTFIEGIAVDVSFR